MRIQTEIHANPDHIPVFSPEERESVGQALLNDYVTHYQRLRYLQGCEGYDDVLKDEILPFWDQHIVKKRSLAQCGLQGIREDMQCSHNALEPVLERADELPRPAMTICMTVADTEDTGLLKTSLQQIAKSQAHFGEPVQVVLWVNGESVDGQAQTENQELYQVLCQTAAPFNSQQMRIVSALDMYPASDDPSEQRTMSRVRSANMDAVIVEATQRGYDVDHPVVWIDADTTYLSRNTLRDLSDTLRYTEALMAHPQFMFSTEWAPENLDDADDITKAIVYREIMHRMYARRHSSNPTEINTYYEESGATFRLGDYLLAGGVDMRDPVSESGTLYNAMAPDSEASRLARQKLRRQLKQHAKLRDTDRAQAPDDFAPTLAQSFNGWLPNARMTASARRMYRTAQSEGMANVSRHGSSGVYRTYIEMAHDPIDTDVVTKQQAGDVPLMYFQLANDRDRRVSARLLDRLFKE